MKKVNNYWLRKAASSRLSRRRFVGGAAMAGAGATSLALVGCGNDDDDDDVAPPPPDDDDNGEPAPTPTPDDEPQDGGTLRTGTFLDVLGIDPHIEVSVGLTTAQRVYTYLIGFDNVNNEYKNLLASGVEQPSETEFVFTLRDDVRFQDIAPVNGRQVTAEDVLYSFERFRDLPEAQNNDFFRFFTDSMEAIDDQTFRLTTVMPYAESLAEIGGSQKAIVPREAVEEWGDLSADAIGAGPYILEEYVRGEREVLVRNPDYFEEGLPRLDAWNRQVILDMSSLLQAYEGDQLDINGALLNKLDFEGLEPLPDRVSGSMPALHYGSLGLNASMEPFNDPRVRRAMYLALDRNIFVNLLGFGDGFHMGPLSAGLEFWSLSQEELAPYTTPNYEEARALLAEAGYEDGFDLPIETSAGVQLYIDHAEIVVDELAKVGVRATLELSDLSTYLSTKLFAGDFGPATIFTHNPYETPKIPLGFYHKDGIGGGSWFGYDNPDVTAAIDAQIMELDGEARREKVREAQFLILDDWAPLINLYSPVAYWSHHERVGGWDPSFRGFQNFRYTEYLRS